MKRLIFILLWLIILSCNNSSRFGNNSITPKRDASSASAYPVADRGIIMCAIDGKSKTLRVHEGFSEMRLEPDSKGTNDGFMPLDGNATKEGFQLEIKNKSTSVFKGLEGVLNTFSYFNSKGVDDVAQQEVTASVTSFDDNHLTGTFSGKFHNTNYKGTSESNPEFIPTTEGKFELNK